MPYSSNGELPPAVKNSLSDAEQSHWREAFNHALTEYKDEKTAFKVAWAAVKKDCPDVRWFEGWASVEKVDLQKDLTEQRTLHDLLKANIERGGEMSGFHQDQPYAAMHDVELKEYEPGVLGNYFCAAVYKGDQFYDGMWQEMKDGKLSAFSIRGFKDEKKSRTECDSSGCHQVLKMRIVTNLSGVPKGACPEAQLTALNPIAKSDSFFSQSADEMMSTCPDCAGIVRALVEKGVPESVAKQNLHALAKGLFDARKRSEGNMTEQDPKEVKKEEKPEEKPAADKPQEPAKNEEKCDKVGAKKDEPDDPTKAPAAPEEPKPKSDTLEAKLNQMFAMLSEMKRDIDELKLANQEAPEEKEEAPSKEPEKVPEKALEELPPEKPAEEKPEKEEDKKKADPTTDKAAVQKAAELLAEKMVREKATDDAVRKGLVTPRPGPDSPSIDAGIAKALEAGFGGSPDILALSYEDTLALSRATRKK